MQDITSLLMFIAMAVAIWAFGRFVRIIGEYRSKVNELNNRIAQLNEESLKRQKDYEDMVKRVRKYEGEYLIWRSMQSDNLLD